MLRSSSENAVGVVRPSDRRCAPAAGGIPASRPPRPPRTRYRDNGVKIRRLRRGSVRPRGTLGKRRAPRRLSNGKSLNILDPLAQLIEHNVAAFEQCLRIDCGFNALGTTVEQPHAQRAFKVRDCVRHHRLRSRKVHGSLRHAARAHYERQDMQVAQGDTSPNPTVPNLSAFTIGFNDIGIVF